MESHKERQHNLIIQSKINKTKDVMKRKANQIDKSKVDNSRISGTGRSSFPGSGGSGRFENGFCDISVSARGGFGNSSSFGSLDPDFTTKIKGRPSATVTAPPKGMGMQLGNSQKANQFLELHKQEGKVHVDEVQVVAPGPATMAVPITDPILIAMQEKLSVVIKRDDGVGSFDVQGEMALVVQKAEDVNFQIQIEQADNRALIPSGILTLIEPLEQGK